MIWFKEKKELKVFIILALIGAISILVGFITDRSICIFYNTTGIPCPSCGMTRAFLKLSKGDILGALFYHPLFPLVFIIPFILEDSKKKFLYAIIVIFIFTWVIRLIVLFPHTSPMVYNDKALYPYIKSIIEAIFN